ncbi:hypothetical protein JL720_10243 [Aureococcus anophagefferens]|nr:hypothetical protein JL720_10243 [Aureococcus anophagefferens]
MVCAACRNMLPFCRIIMLPFLLLPYAWAGTPTQLVVDLKPVPALGVSTSPMFRWAVAPCDDATDAMQTSYAITVTDAADAVIWDSGTVASPTALAAYGGAALNGSASYAWTVTTTSDACGASAAATGSFVWVAGELLGCGPGRGEAPMARDGTNATFRTGAYDTYDVTRFFGDGGAVAVAAQGVASKDAHPQVGGHFFGDFGREFEGGLTFATAEGVDGVVLRVTTGESAANSTVGDAWGFVFNLTLRGGPMRYETHQYMEFRYVQVDVLAGSFDVATDLDVGAWTAEYPYDAAESSFDSSDATLDGVYELARWTVEAGVLDTFTDSNTRERRPYEADMLCAGTARLWVQRDAALLRHSVSYVLEAPTKPPNKCSSPPAGPGHHIVDWFPGPSGAMFRASDHLSVDQAFAVAGLRKLAATAGGAVAKAAAADADALYAAMKTHMWNASANRYCDGACADVAGHAGVTTARAWGLEGFGSYGAFIYLSALAACDVDDGSAMLEALTKCDAQSWCAEMRDSGATMTRESWAGGTYSHPWGTAALVGVSAGVLGVAQTAPAWRNFTVKPKLGNLTFANGVVPTLAGPVAVNATPTATAVVVPPNSRATVCVANAAPAAAARRASSPRPSELPFGAEYY